MPRDKGKTSHRGSRTGPSSKASSTAHARSHGKRGKAKRKKR